MNLNASPRQRCSVRGQNLGLLLVIDLHNTTSNTILFVEKKTQIEINHLHFRLDKDAISFYSQGDNIVIWTTGNVKASLSLVSSLRCK